MNRLCGCALLLITAAACVGKYDSNAEEAEVLIRQASLPLQADDTLTIDLRRSRIHWKGTKMRGAGKHEGDISLLEGKLLMKNGMLSGGNFEVDMNSITVTDIPEHEPVPRRNLTNHLKSEDFFAVERYPVASFEMTQVQPLGSDSLSITGNLRIKGITRAISFKVEKLQNAAGPRFRTVFTFNRFEWDIAYMGSWADRNLVDEMVELTIELAASAGN